MPHTTASPVVDRLCFVARKASHSRLNVLLPSPHLCSVSVSTSTRLLSNLSPLSSPALSLASSSDDGGNVGAACGGPCGQRHRPDRACDPERRPRRRGRCHVGGRRRCRRRRTVVGVFVGRPVRGTHHDAPPARARAAVPRSAGAANAGNARGTRLPAQPRTACPNVAAPAGVAAPGDPAPLAVCAPQSPCGAANVRHPQQHPKRQQRQPSTCAGWTASKFIRDPWRNSHVPSRTHLPTQVSCPVLPSPALLPRPANPLLFRLTRFPR